VSDSVPTPDASGVREFLDVMNRLRSPGGCPWDAEQTHESLIPHLIEEAYEVVEAIETGSRADLREELGDLLLQVVFHARIAQEHDEEPFNMDDIARTIAAKLRRRHPYVYPDAAEPGENESMAEAVTSIADQEVTWESAKAAEKQRESVFDGIPLALPPLMRAHKILHRARRAGLKPTPPEASTDPGEGQGAGRETSSKIGQELLAIVARAEEADVDAQAALRQAVRELEMELRRQENTGPPT